MSPAEAEIDSRLQAAVRFAREAGRFTLTYFQQGVAFERKTDNSPVTLADRGAEQLLRERIAAAFPRDAVLGEEFGETPGDSGYRWVLDPIDGTKSFICGVPLYTVLIGILRGEQSVAGVIEAPGLNERAYAAVGQSAWWQSGDAAPAPARVSARTTLSDGVFVCSQVDSFQHRGADDVYRDLERLAYVTRSWGDGYGYLLVATGRVELMVDPVMNLWDAAAILPVLEGAGGTFTDWVGQRTVQSGEGLATNGRVLEQVLEITRRAVRPR